MYVLDNEFPFHVLSPRKHMTGLVLLETVLTDTEDSLSDAAFPQESIIIIIVIIIINHS